jgi:hypothetical protein
MLVAEQIVALGYAQPRRIGDRWCALARFNFTTALVAGIDSIGHGVRYCFEHAADAAAALAAWDGQGHPPGPWIKAKGAGIDLLNPELRA